MFNDWDSLNANKHQSCSSDFDLSWKNLERSFFEVETARKVYERNIFEFNFAISSSMLRYSGHLYNIKPQASRIGVEAVSTFFDVIVFTKFSWNSAHDVTQGSVSIGIERQSWFRDITSDLSYETFVNHVDKKFTNQKVTYGRWWKCESRLSWLISSISECAASNDSSQIFWHRTFGMTTC